MEDYNPQLILTTLTASMTSDIYKLSQKPEFQINAKISVKEVEKITAQALEVIRMESILLELTSDITVVGDLHGHFLDLLRIFKEYGMPPARKYLFLGDYVDRGEFSFETITLLLLLKTLYPKSVFLIRGNHEFDDLCKRSGFYDEMTEIYGAMGYDLYQKFLEVFSYLPLSAIIDNKILCVHGGLGPKLTDLKHLRQFQRPLLDFEEENLDAILWSDPSTTIQGFEVSSRGSGFFFGAASVANFLEKTNLKVIIRAHECVYDGYHEMFDGQLITVFSASNYCGLVQNQSAVLQISNGNITPFKLPPLGYAKRVKTIIKSAPSLIRPSLSGSTNPLLSRNSTHSIAKANSFRLKDTKKMSRRMSTSLLLSHVGNGGGSIEAKHSSPLFL